MPIRVKLPLPRPSSPWVFTSWEGHLASDPRRAPKFVMTVPGPERMGSPYSPAVLLAVSWISPRVAPPAFYRSGSRSGPMGARGSRQWPIRREFSCGAAVEEAGRGEGGISWAGADLERQPTLRLAHLSL